MAYEMVVGLEVHLQLSTATKLFCGCRAAFGAPANSQTCPVCLGLPGVLPVLNTRALDWGVRVALAFECRMAGMMRFDRKQYFYPDLPKNYQISQFDNPLAEHGGLEIVTEAGTKRIGIRRIHMEEDAGKLLHENNATQTLVDFNRAGVPLLEIVTEPDIRTADEAYEYLVSLKSTIQYLDVSTCNMEEGSLRCDTNVSLRQAGATELGSKVEIKNLNSFRAVKQALDYEVKRQTEMLDRSLRIPQETRLWDAKRQVTESMRSKEGSADYRYFPEPDLVPFVIEAKRVEQAQSAMPELPAKRRERFEAAYALSAYDAGVLTQLRAVADLYETALKTYAKPKPLANWVMGDLLGYLNAKNKTIEDVSLRPEWLAQLLELIDAGTLSGKMAKDVLAQMLEKGIDPKSVVQQGALQQISDTGALDAIADSVIQAFPSVVGDYTRGKPTALMYLVGQGMKRSQGKANPQQLTEAIRRKLDKTPSTSS